MLHKLFSTAMLGVILSTGLLAAGCKSDNGNGNGNAQSSYGLTGNSNDNAAQNPRYYDSKGHYRSDWVDQK